MAGIQVSHHHLKRAQEHAAKLHAKLKHASAKAEAAMGQLIDAGVSVGAAASIGFLHGRYGAVEVMGVPVELGAGLALTAAAAVGFGGKFQGAIGAAGAGALGAYAYNMARGTGSNLRAKSKLPTGGKAEESPAVTGDTILGLPSARLHKEELAAIQEPVAAQR